MDISRKIKNKKIVIATHIYATGPTHALEGFLRDKVKSLIFIGHPFVYAPDTRSHLRIYKNGLKEKEIYVPEFSKSQFLSVIKDTVLTAYWVTKNGRQDIFIGADVFNAFVGLILVKLGIVKTSIFYTIDYIPQRFPNKLMNSIYHWLDSLCVKHCDSVWNLSNVMINERENKGIPKKFRKKQILVPMGTIKPKPMDVKKIKKHTAVHMGHLIEKQGMQLVLESMPEIIKRIPDFHIDILGSGDYESRLKKLARKYKVEKHITFFGYIKSHEDIEKRLPFYCLGYAPYTSDPNNYIQYTDPGKVKAYLSAGLPIIITKTAKISKEIHNSGAGVAIKYDGDEIVKATLKIIASSENLIKFRRSAENMASKYTWDKIFTAAISRLL